MTQEIFNFPVNVFFCFVFFLKSFLGEHIHMSYFGATGTPVLDFW